MSGVSVMAPALDTSTMVTRGTFGAGMVMTSRPFSNMSEVHGAELVTAGVCAWTRVEKLEAVSPSPKVRTKRVDRNFSVDFIATPYFVRQFRQCLSLGRFQRRWL